jgi:hypothetical protein
MNKCLAQTVLVHIEETAGGDRDTDLCTVREGLFAKTLRRRRTIRLALDAGRKP